MKTLENTGWCVPWVLSMRCALLVGGTYGQTLNLTQCIPTLSILQRAASHNGLDQTRHENTKYCRDVAINHTHCIN